MADAAAIQTSTIEPARQREFTTCERAVLKERRVDEDIASRFPAHLSTLGVCDLVDAGVPASIASAAPSHLSSGAILGFLRARADLDDVDYDDRFYNPNFLADSGIPASAANAYPHHLDEIDLVRLHEAGFGPRDSESIPPGWPVADIVKLASTGVSTVDADRFRDVVALPPEMLGRCIRAGIDPAALATWLAAVGPSIRTDPATLVHVALESKRLDDPEGFRFDLIRVAVRSILAAEGDDTGLRSLVDRMLRVLQSGGEISTTIPDSWTRERLLFVGPNAAEVCSIVVIPDEPLLFDYGDLEEVDARARIDLYLESLR